MRLSSYVLSVTLLSVSAAVTHADTFNFSFGTAASAFSGSGMLTGSPIAGTQADLITAVTGSAATMPNGGRLSITSILAPNTFPTPSNGGSFPANDNTLFVLGGVGTLTQNGLSFILSNGAQINLYNSASGGDALLLSANGSTSSEAATIAITPVTTTPEPASYTLLGTGLLGFVGLLKRRRLSTGKVAALRRGRP